MQPGPRLRPPPGRPNLPGTCGGKSSGIPAMPGETIAAQMVPMAQLLDDKGVDDVVAHIATLPDERAGATLKGDLDRGKDLFVTCASCHGAHGQGVWSTRAPRLAGMSDWYLARQLENFRRGNRGRHPQDFYGTQMASLSRMVHDEQSERDLVAYINTL